MNKIVTLIAVTALVATSSSVFAGGGKRGGGTYVGAAAGSQSQSGAVAGARGGDARSASGAYSGGSASGAYSGGSQSGAQITQNTYGSNGVRYSGSYTVRNTPAAVAPALTTTLTETCMGSTSVGASGPGFGVSFGTTWRDTACVRRLDARQILALGHADAATELMCDSEAVRGAFRRVGRPCHADRGAPVAAPRASSEYGFSGPRYVSNTPAPTTRRKTSEVGGFGF